MSGLGTAERSVGFGRVEDRIGEGPLVLKREGNKLSPLDRLLRHLLCSGDDEVTQAAPLDLGSALDERQRPRRDTGFQAGRAGLRLGHDRDLYGKTPDNSRKLTPPWSSRWPSAR